MYSHLHAGSGTAFIQSHTIVVVQQPRVDEIQTSSSDNKNELPILICCIGTLLFCIAGLHCIVFFGVGILFGCFFVCLYVAIKYSK